MITDQQFKSWLKQPDAIRCVLIEADVKLASSGVVVTRYLSSQGYTTGNSDVPANTSYSARVTGGVKFTRSLSLDGQASLSFGDIELNNTDGALDSWLDDYWVNRQIRVYLGDTRWARSDFRLVFTGVMTGADTRTRTRLNLKISDKLQRLNNPVTEAIRGGSGTNSEDLLPLLFGECHNITPLQIDSTVNEYMVHNGPIERIIEVRDNGVPVEFLPYLTEGKFRLTKNPAGVITVSAQGARISVLGGGTTYTNNMMDIVRHLMTNYGGATTRLSDIDLDISGMLQFKSDNPQPVGIYLSDRQNVLDVVTKLVSSVGARPYVTTAGLVGFVKLSLPQASPGTQVTSNDILDRSLEIKQLADVVASVKMGYDRNWTVQTGLTTGIIPEHAALYAEEWLTMTAKDSLTAANYNLYTDPVLQESFLLTAADALSEAQRRLAIFKTQRKVLKYTGFYHLIFETLGGPQTLTHSRFGLSGGKTGQIISISMDLMSPHVDFEVLI